MRKRILTVTLVTVLMAVLLLGRTTVPVAADPVTNEPSQDPSPFTEIFPGVYMYWQWWNQSSIDMSDEDGYYSLSDEGNESDGHHDDDWYENEWYYVVTDVNGTSYYIYENGTYNYVLDWSFSNLLVSIIVDPDGSFVTWVSKIDLEPEDLWTILYDYDKNSLSGDEVVIFSSFYYSTIDYSYSLNATYTWYDDEMNIVNPNTIIPLLSPEFNWASSLVGTVEINEQFSYSGFGYDVNELTIRNNETQWIEHYFAGMSVFDDRNGNGVMDMVYDTIAFDVDGDGIPDVSYQSLNRTASELEYYFVPYTAELGAVTTPYVNDKGQLEWSAEVVNIEGQFVSEQQIFAMSPEFGAGFSMVESPNPIDAKLTSLSMTYRFEITNDAVVLKIDQHVGDFIDPVTGDHITSLDGLGLTLDYWSAFSAHQLSVERYDDFLDDDDESSFMPPVGDDDDDDYNFTDDDHSSDIPDEDTDDESDDIEDEIPELIIGIDNETFVAVNFGGTYLWSYDGNTYNVGTAVYQQYIYCFIFDEVEAAEEGLSIETEDWRYSTYYYSSCYANWSGYAITHDPIFAVYPDNAPGEVSGYINELMTASSILVIGGSIAVVAVVVRIYMVRKRV